MPLTDYPQYRIDVTLDNGMTFQSWISATSGLPQALEDELAASAASAIKAYDWASFQISPPATSATVILTREDITSTVIPVS